MRKRSTVLSLIAITLVIACNRNENKFDASGTFEADEVIVSASTSGKILSLTIDEGSTIAKDSIIGLIDPVDLSLQKQQVQASIEVLGEKTTTAAPQVKLLEDQLSVQTTQLNDLDHERKRIENLLKDDAATKKQLDDINFQIESLKKQMNVTRQQINVQKSNVATQNRSILSEGKPLQKRAEQLQEQLNKTNILNPVTGTVITKYAEAGEVTSSGKALYKIADLSVMTLRAYVNGEQLPQIKLGQQLTVFVDSAANHYRQLPGTITWISDKAEFTPKTIQTKDERANLVYAVKIKVENDGYLKIGMYGDVRFNRQ
jgi:HlyD family secretion protein